MAHDRIIVVRSGAIGDTILLAPVVHGLRRAYPSAEIFVVGHFDRVSLLVGPSFATQALSLDQPGIPSLYSETPDLPSATRDIFQSALWVLWFGEDLDGNLRRNMEELCPGRFLLHSPNPKPRRHISDHLMDALDRISVPRPEFVPPLEVSGDLPPDLTDILSGREGAGDRVVVHPGAGNSEKRLSPGIWAGVLLSLSHKKAIRPIIVTGPKEHDLGMDLAEEIHELNPVWIHDHPLREVAALLANVDLYLGHDSGITHLAAAIGCRTVAVFRSTDPAVWSPCGPHVHIAFIRNENDAVRLIQSMSI
ncbi:MAG TPA: glycosyltransferase family 9 protein [bacterium]|nr:glycosyltransferase family 9 protein [bacterium]HQL63198.1 glycosyltransferase family 9 protein [bacterium]